MEDDTLLLPVMRLRGRLREPPIRPEEELEEDPALDDDGSSKTIMADALLFRSPPSAGGDRFRIILCVLIE